MNYDEWLAALLPFETKALTRREIFQAGAASRDAEVAELVAAIKFWMKAEGNYDLIKADKLFRDALAKVRKP